MKYLISLILAFVVGTAEAQFVRTLTPTTQKNEKGDTLHSAGSAVLIAPDIVLTANHCVEQGILVTRFKGKDIVGKPVYQDESSDLAIVKLSELPEGVTPITLGVANIGEKIWAGGFGAPDQEFKLQEGKLTGKRIGEDGGPESWVHGFRARHGDSGGPVLNAHGDLVGIVTQISDIEDKEHPDAITFFIEPMGLIKHSQIAKRAAWDSVYDVEPYEILAVQARERLRATIIQMYLETYIKKNGLPVPDLNKGDK